MSDISLSAPVSLSSALQPEMPGKGVQAAVGEAAKVAGGKNISLANVDAISKDFEAVFLSQMMGAMFSGDELTSYFGGGSAGDIYKSFLMNEYGKAMAKTGGVGIAAQVKKELLKLQEVA